MADNPRYSKNPFENPDWGTPEESEAVPEQQPAAEEPPVEEGDSALDFGKLASLREGASGSIPLAELPDPQSNPSLLSWTEVIRQHRQGGAPSDLNEPVKIDSVSDKDLLQRIVAEEQARTQAPPAKPAERDTDKIGKIPLVSEGSAGLPSSSVELTNEAAALPAQSASGSVVQFDMPNPPSDAGGAMPNPWLSEEVPEAAAVEEDDVPLADLVLLDDEPEAMHATDAGVGGSVARLLAAEDGDITDSPPDAGPISEQSSILGVLLQPETGGSQRGHSASGLVDLATAPDVDLQMEGSDSGSNQRFGSSEEITLADEAEPIGPGSGWLSGGSDTSKKTMSSFRLPDDMEGSVDLYTHKPATHELSESGSLQISDEELAEAARQEKLLQSSAIDLGSHAHFGSNFDLDITSAKSGFKGGSSGDETVDMTLPASDPGEASSMIRNFDDIMKDEPVIGADWHAQQAAPVDAGAGWGGEMPIAHDAEAAAEAAWQDEPAHDAEAAAEAAWQDEPAHDAKANVAGAWQPQASDADIVPGSVWQEEAPDPTTILGKSWQDTQLPVAGESTEASVEVEPDESPMMGSIRMDADDLPTPRRRRQTPEAAFPATAEIVEENEAPEEVVEEEEPPIERAPKAGKKGGGLLVGSLLGLVIGAGGLFGAYYMELIPDPKTMLGEDGGKQDNQAKNPANPTTPKPIAAEPATPQVARQFLEAGNPSKAVEAFGQCADQEAADVLAGLGQAKWLAHLQQCAKDGKSPTKDDEEVAGAIKDLEAAVEKAKTDENAEADAARAYLWQGLIKETFGDFEGAEKVYNDAAAEMKVAANRALFTSALNRLQVVKPAQGVPITAIPAEHLLLAFTLLLADEPRGTPPASELAGQESGVMFWEAMLLAAKHDYAKAADKIPIVKAVHARQQIAMAGRGLNPQSDPREQILPICLDELERYWKLCDQLYKRPEAKTLVEQKKIAEALAAALVKPKDDEAMKLVLDKLMVKPEQKVLDVIDEVLKARKEAEDGKKLAEDGKKLAEDGKKLADDMLVAIGKSLKDAGIDEPKVDEGIKKLAAGKIDADTKVKTVADALDKAGIKEPDVAKAIAMLVAGRDDADAVVKGLRERFEKAKLVDANAAKDVVFKAIDDAIVRGSGDAIVKLDKEKKDAEAKAAKAEADLDTVKKDTDATVVKAKADADLLVKKAEKEAADQKAAYEAKLASASKDFVGHATKSETSLKEGRYDEAIKEYMTGLKTLALPKQYEDLFDRIVALHPKLQTVSTGGGDSSLGQKHYNLGLEHYRDGRFAPAEQEFLEAVRFDNKDARYSYFLGLARWQQGKTDLAIADFKRGASLELLGRPTSRAVNSSLERIQGEVRSNLEKYRP